MSNPGTLRGYARQDFRKLNEQKWVDLNDVDYRVQPTNRIVVYRSLKALRTIFLPLARSFPRGATLRIADGSGQIVGSTSIVLLITPQPSDQINGRGAGLSDGIVMPYGAVELMTDGAYGWVIVDSSHKGVLATATATANQGSITTEVDLTSMSCTIYALNGHSYKISWFAPSRNSGSGNQNVVKLTDSVPATMMSAAIVSGAAATTETIAGGPHIMTGITGSNVFKLRAVASAGTMTMFASASLPCTLTVEDATP